MAQLYAVKGWAVFPCAPRGKEPLVKGGVLAATTNPEQISSWWERYPDANIGVATGASGLVVIDFDSLSALAGLPAELPPTLASRTGKGLHLWYKERWAVQPSVGRLPGLGTTPGVDLRAANSYVLAPPSVHPSGAVYRWEYKWNTTAVPAPLWLKPEPQVEVERTEVAAPTAYAAGALRNTMQRIRAAKEGERNHTLNREVYSLNLLVKDGLLEASLVKQEALRAAKDIGLSDFEALRTIESAMRSK